MSTDCLVKSKNGLANFNEHFRSLLKNIFDGKSYKQMNIVSQVFATIVTLPFWAVVIGLAATYYVYRFFICIISVPADYLLSFIREESDKVKGWTEEVIYLIGFPIIYIIKIAVSTLSVTIWFWYMLTNIFGFFASVGGCEFSPFLNDLHLTGKHTYARNFKKVALIMICIIFSLIVLGCLFSAMPTTVVQLHKELIVTAPATQFYWTTNSSPYGTFVTVTDISTGVEETYYKKDNYNWETKTISGTLTLCIYENKKATKDISLELLALTVAGGFIIGIAYTTYIVWVCCAYAHNQKHGDGADDEDNCNTSGVDTK